MLAKLDILWRCMKGNRMLYVGAFFFSALATFFWFSGPLVLKTTIDSVIGNKPVLFFNRIFSVITYNFGDNFLVRNIWICSIALILLTIVNGFFSYISMRWCARASECTAENIRLMLYDHIQNLQYNDHVNMETGDLIQRCTSDVETIRKFIAIEFIEIGRALCMLAIALPIMFHLHTKLSIIALMLIPVTIIFSFIFFRRVQVVFKHSDEAEGMLSNVLQENLNGVRVVRAFANQQFELLKFDEKNRNFRDLTYKLICVIAVYWSLSDFLAMMQIGLVVTVGTYFALSHTVSIGTLVVFISYEGMLLWPIRQMGRILADMGKAMVSLGRIKEILDKEIEQDEEISLCPVISGGIEFRNVSFQYGNEPEILRDISFTIKPGTTVAILGRTGSGKSTLIHLLQRFYDYSEGSITIDNIELNKIGKKWIRRNIGIVLQEPFLYAKTVMENIGLAKSRYCDEDVTQAAEIAFIHKDIISFDKGYETLVGEKGVTLSGGQKQRVAIARAVIKKCPIIIFDDSLSSVDLETEYAIRKALKERNSSATTIIISHRVSTLADADIILVIDNGKLIESGTHVELLKKQGFYKKMWAIQHALEDDLLEELEPVSVK